MRRFQFLIALLFLVFSLSAQDEITWKDEIVLDGTFKYIRLCKVTKGPAAGDIIMTYFQSDHSAPFGMRRSKDEGRTWGNETIFMRNTSINYYVNPGILQLDDGRLMLSYCKRAKTDLGTIPEQGPCVRFSTDGGYTWGAETFICWGGDYEPTAIQVPNDKNKDGNNDIYLYWTMTLADQSYDLNTASTDDVKRGNACGVVASYDNGVTWENFMPTKLGARIVHRNFNEPANETYMGSRGNMPTPVLLPGHRVGVVCEAVNKSNSPWFTVSDSGDWDWENFQGQQWSSYTYFGYPPYNVDDDNVYPMDRSKCWRPTYTDNTFGGAPYVSVMANGKIVFSQNSAQDIKVFVADAYGKNSIKQVDPFLDKQSSFYSCIIPLNDHEVIVAAHDPVDMSKAYIRIGEIIKDTQPPATPKNVMWTKADNKFHVNWTAATDNNVVQKYEIFANENLVKTVLWDNSTIVEGLNANTKYVFSVRAMDYQGNYSQLSTGLSTGLQVEDFKVFPSPVDNFMQIQTTGQYYSTEIWSIEGKKLMICGMNATQIDVSGLHQGFYLLSIEKNGNKIIRKFVKN